MSTRDQQSDRERTAAASETNESAPSFLDEEHDASWSANLEQERYADDRETLIEHALAAINRTEPDYHVNLVTHPNHGTPEEYLEAPIHDHYPTQRPASSISAVVAVTCIASSSELLKSLRRTSRLTCVHWPTTSGLSAPTSSRIASTSSSVTPFSLSASARYAATRPKASPVIPIPS